MKDNFNQHVLKSFGVIFCAIIVATIVFYFLVGSIDSQSSDIVAHRALIAKENNLLAAFVEIKKNVAEAAKYKMAMDKLLPAQNELINFPRWLQNVAATYNVTTNFSFTADTALATITAPGTIRFSIIVQGKNGDVISFLKNLESQAPGFLLSFETFDLSQNGPNTKVVVGGKMFFK